MEALLVGIEALETFDGESVETVIRELADKNGIKAGDIIHPLRFSLTNTTVSPSIFEIIEFLGETEVLNRVKGFIEFLK